MRKHKGLGKGGMSSDDVLMMRGDSSSSLSSSPSLMLDPVHIVLGEIQNVLAAMRLNRRWTASMQNAHKQESPLLQGFKRLMVILGATQNKDLQQMDTMVYVEPFLEVIRSEETSGPITGVALSSMNKFLRGFIRADSPNAPRAMALIAEAVTNCRFEATDPETDEVILMKILQVLLSCVQCNAGLLLTEDVIFEMVQTCFRMTVQTRLSGLLRWCAESTLMEMVLYVFANYNQSLPEPSTSNLNSSLNSSSGSLNPSSSPSTPNLSHTVPATPTNTPATPTFHIPSSPLVLKVNPSTGEAEQQTDASLALQNGDEASANGTEATLSVGGVDISERTLQNTASGSINVILPAVVQSPSGEEGQKSVMFVNPQGVSFEPLDTTRPIGGRPYGIPCLVKIFHFLSSLCDTAKPDSEDIRLLGLTILINIIEARGPVLVEIPQIRNDIQVYLCKFLLISMQSRNIGIFTSVLRLYFGLYLCAKQYLKTHTEAFFTSLMARIVDNKNTPYEQQELALESLVEFCKLPYIIADMYINYDCDISSSNLVEMMCKQLHRNTVPPANSPLFTIHLLSLDCLLAIAKSIHDRLPSAPFNGQASPLAQQFQQNKAKKIALAEAAAQFNKDPKEGMKYLKTNNIVDPSDPKSVATFLKSTPRLDKTLVGGYLGKRDNIAITKEYAQLFDFPTQKFHNCVRHFLETFRIPGESQIIERILEPFSTAYFNYVTSKGDNMFANADVAYLFVYATVLLNVDQHSPNVKNRMSLEDFIKSVKYIPNSNLIPREFISDLYHDVRAHEIRIPEEFPSGEVTSVTFEDLLRRAKHATPYADVQTSDHDRDIFYSMWGQIVSAVSFIFDKTEDLGVLEKATNGYHMCATIASHYGCFAELDNLVTTLCKSSTLLNPLGENALITFGRDSKAQQATLAVFKITRLYADNLREGWRNVLTCMISLQQMDVLDTLQDMVVDFEGVAPSIRTSTGPEATHTKSHASLLSPFGLLGTAAWFGGGGGDHFDSEPSEEEKAAEDAAKKVVAECHVRDIILGTKDQRSDSLVYFVKALILASVRPKKATQSSRLSSTSPTPSQLNSSTSGSALNTSTSSTALLLTAPNSTERVVLFCLNLLTHITLINHERIILFWALVRDHLYSYITTVPSSPPVPPIPIALLEKAIFSIMYLCIHLAHKTEMTEQLLKGLQEIAKLDHAIIEYSSAKLLSALLKLCEQNRTLVSTPLTYTSIFQLVSQISISTPVKAQERAVDVIDSLLSSPNFLSSESFPLVLQSLSEFTRSNRPSSVSIAAMRQMDRLFSMVLQFLGLSLEDDDSKDVLPAEASKSQQFIANQNKRKKEEKKKEAWSKYWLPIIKHLSDLCRDSRGDVRNNAMTHLQRALLSPYLGILTPQGWFVCFEEAVFPLLSELLQSQEMDLGSLEETRLRACVLLSKIFLQHLYTIIASTSFRALWVKILLFIEMYMKADNSELLAEAVPESLKNVLLVMIASGLFQADANVPPPPPPTTTDPEKAGEDEDFWTASWQIIDGFCPSLKEDVFAKLGRPMSPSVLHVTSPPPQMPPLAPAAAQELPPLDTATAPLAAPEAPPSPMLPEFTSQPPSLPQQDSNEPAIPHFSDSSDNTFQNLIQPQAISPTASPHLQSQPQPQQPPQQQQQHEVSIGMGEDNSYDSHLLYNYNNPGSNSPLAPQFSAS